MSIGKAYLKNGIDASALDNIVDFGEVTTALQKIAADFATRIEQNINTYKLIASGDLAKKIIIETSDDGKTVNIIMQDYYDYVNQGVKGVTSSRNAPNSPYQYKHYRMNAEGRASIKQYISSGRAKIRTVQNDKALGIGLERKGVNVTKKKALIDTQVDTMIYYIKKYGLKATNYFTKAYEETLKDFDIVMAKAVERSIIITLKGK